MKVVTYVFAAPWLGHGRAFECFIAVVAIHYGLQLLSPHAAFDSKATADLAWWGYGHLLAYPLLIYGVAAAIGLLGNIRGWRYSRPLRVFGATCGTVIWTTYSAKFALLGDTATVGFPFTVPTAIFSVRVLGLAMAGLPRPGAPGAL